MARQVVQQFDGLNPNVRASLPDEAEIVEFCEDGGIIVREPLPHTDESVKEPVIDPETGEQAVREYETAQGTFRTKVWTWPERTTQLVKYEPRKTGRVVRNTDFQETDEVRRRRERQRKVEEFQEELAVEAVEAGLSVSDLVRLLKQDAAENGESAEGGAGTAPEATATGEPVQTAETVAETPDPEVETNVADEEVEELEELLDAEEGIEGHEDFELEMVRPGVWGMPDDSEYPADGDTCSKAEAVAHIAEEFGEGLALQLTQES